jgi:hypothetical protein
MTVNCSFAAGRNTQPLAGAFLRLSLWVFAPDDIGAQQDYIRIKATGKGAKCPEN